MSFQFNLYIWFVMTTKAHIATFYWIPIPVRSFVPTRHRP